MQVAVENTFGRLKGRFLCLQNFVVWDIKQAYWIIKALLIIQNIIEEAGDDPTEIAGYNGVEDDDVVALREERHLQDTVSTNILYWVGIHRRKRLVEEWRKR